MSNCVGCDLGNGGVRGAQPCASEANAPGRPFRRKVSRDTAVEAQGSDVITQATERRVSMIRGRDRPVLHIPLPFERWPDQIQNVQSSGVSSVGLPN